MAFHAADTHRATCEGAARKGRLKERCGLTFFRLRNRQKLVRIRFENMRDMCSFFLDLKDIKVLGVRATCNFIKGTGLL